MSLTHKQLSSVKTEAGLLPRDLLSRLQAGEQLLGSSPKSYHLAKHERIGEAVNRSWSRLTTLWTGFREGLERRPESDRATGYTRDRWLLPLFQELGYGRLPKATAIEVDKRSYAISHHWHRSPLHLIGARVDLDRRQKGVAGAARSSPHGLVQDFLNRSEGHLWGFLCNGLRLRILRDHHSLTRQAYVEFDLESIMEGEHFSEFLLLWMLCHQSRVEAEKPEDCWLETWFKTSRDEGVRALDKLRGGVERAIACLGSGFLSHRQNADLRAALKQGSLNKQEFYRQLLRLVYRLIFLFVAEERDVLLDPRAAPEARARYQRWYANRRLRELAEKRRGTTHGDLWQGLSLVMKKLYAGCAELALPALGSDLWGEHACPHLMQAACSNEPLLAALRCLCHVEEGRTRYVTNWRNIGAEELGSIYESLLELHPVLHVETGRFELETAAGHERKTTGSYYTPTALVDCLLDSALEPVLDRACRDPEPEKAILNLKVCDPAVGSGHFLLAAARRIAHRLAQVRSGDDEPSPDRVQRALRDVVGRCLFGVDLNPMAVELCKVSLWLEAVTPGLPLSFLDAHLQVGNSLLGTTRELMAQGIPDKAFKPIEGDSKKVASALKKQNKAERKQKGWQRTMFDSFDAASNEREEVFAAKVLEIEALADVDLRSVEAKQARYSALQRSKEYRREKFLADAWCAAFVADKAAGAKLEPITTGRWRQWSSEAQTPPPSVVQEVERLAEEYRLFHWHVAFPQVYGEDGTGGFDLVLGNPPWEHLELKEKEFFSTRNPSVAQAQTASLRKKKIAALEHDDPALFEAYCLEKRQFDGTTHLIRSAGRFPLCARGRINTYSIFAELNRLLISDFGRVGCVVPSGIATDDTTKHFFGDLLDRRSLLSLYDFQSGPGYFAEIGHARFKFCLLTLVGANVERPQETEFAFFLRDVAHLQDPERRFTLSAEDIALINPNTKTCPIFRTRRDAEITRDIYSRVPVLIREGDPQGNPWGLSFRQGLFNMSSDSHLFRTHEQLQGEGFQLEGNVFSRTGERYLPLYEAKMVHHFDHRFGDYRDKLKTSQSTALPEVPAERKNNPDYCVLPRYWVPASEVEARLEGRWDRGWLLGWRDITNATNERTVIASVVPRVGVGNNLPISFTHADSPATTLLACIASFALDFAARFKVGGTHLNFFISHQLPIPHPATFENHCPWDQATSLRRWLDRRTAELVYTEKETRSYAVDTGVGNTTPFLWNESRRFLLRCELDAAFFHLYGIRKDDVDYIMDTFPIARRKDKKEHNEYRTKRVILEIYDAMAEASRSGERYQTRLAPPPAHPSLCHPERRPEPFARVPVPRPEDRYRLAIPLWSLAAAAGGFSEPQAAEEKDWVQPHSRRSLRSGMFVARVVGTSMQPRIPDGSWCLFQSPVTGTRQGRIVLAQHRSFTDPETGGSYTVKRFTSAKVSHADGWQHTAIRLEPLNPEHEPIELSPEQGEDLSVVAEFLEVLS